MRESEYIELYVDPNGLNERESMSDTWASLVEELDSANVVFFYRSDTLIIRKTTFANDSIYIYIKRLK